MTIDCKVFMASFYDIVYFTLIIFIFVFWVFYKLILNFYFKSNPDSNKKNSIHFSYSFLGQKLTPSNSFFLELVWTIIPIFMIFIIYLPMMSVLSIPNYYGSVFDFKNNLFKHEQNKILLKSFSESWMRSYYSMEVLYSVFILQMSIDNNPFTHIVKMFGCKDTTKSMKVMGNQWYWMYESNADFILNDGYSEFEDEDIYSYMFDSEDYFLSIPSIEDLTKLSYPPLITNPMTFMDTCSSFELLWLLSRGDYYFDNSMKPFFSLFSADTYPVLTSGRLYNFYMSSYDVIHSWAMPSMGMKVDACPGSISSFKVKFGNTGYYYGQCSELCGFLHGFMPINLKVW